MDSEAIITFKSNHESSCFTKCTRFIPHESGLIVALSHDNIATLNPKTLSCSLVKKLPKSKRLGHLFDGPAVVYDENSTELLTISYERTTIFSDLFHHEFVQKEASYDSWPYDIIKYNDTWFVGAGTRIYTLEGHDLIPVNDDGIREDNGVMYAFFHVHQAKLYACYAELINNQLLEPNYIAVYEDGKFIKTGVTVSSPGLLHADTHIMPLIDGRLIIFAPHGHRTEIYITEFPNMNLKLLCDVGFDCSRVKPCCIDHTLFIPSYNGDQFSVYDCPLLVDSPVFSPVHNYFGFPHSQSVISYLINHQDLILPSLIKAQHSTRSYQLAEDLITHNLLTSDDLLTLIIDHKISVWTKLFLGSCVSKTITSAMASPDTLEYIRHSLAEFITKYKRGDFELSFAVQVIKTLHKAGFDADDSLYLQAPELRVFASWKKLANYKDLGLSNNPHLLHVADDTIISLAYNRVSSIQLPDFDVSQIITVPYAKAFGTVYHGHCIMQTNNTFQILSKDRFTIFNDISTGAFEQENVNITAKPQDAVNFNGVWYVRGASTVYRFQEGVLKSVPDSLLKIGDNTINYAFLYVCDNKLYACYCYMKDNIPTGPNMLAVLHDDAFTPLSVTTNAPVTFDYHTHIYPLKNHQLLLFSPYNHRKELWICQFPAMTIQLLDELPFDSHGTQTCAVDNRLYIASRTGEQISVYRCDQIETHHTTFLKEQQDTSVAMSNLEKLEAIIKEQQEKIKQLELKIDKK